jgi:hypothetical protein
MTALAAAAAPAPVMAQMNMPGMHMPGMALATKKNPAPKK